MGSDSMTPSSSSASTQAAADLHERALRMDERRVAAAEVIAGILWGASGTVESYDSQADRILALVQERYGAVAEVADQAIIHIEHIATELALSATGKYEYPELAANSIAADAHGLRKALTAALDALAKVQR